MFLSGHSLCLATELTEALDVISTQPAQFTLPLTVMFAPVTGSKHTHVFTFICIILTPHENECICYSLVPYTHTHECTLYVHVHVYTHVVNHYMYMYVHVYTSTCCSNGIGKNNR